MRLIAIILGLWLLGPAMADEPSSQQTKPTQARASTHTTSASGQPDKSQELTEADKRLLSQGYKLHIVNGEKRFCRKERVLGSNLERNVCGSAEQFAESSQAGRDLTDRIQRNQTNPSGR